MITSLTTAVLITVAAFVLNAIAGGMGALLGHFGSQKFGADGKFARIISFANLVAWLSPMFGFFMSVATLVAANKSTQSATKMRTMAAICMAASSINCIAGAVIMAGHSV
ncbi:MAG TPA: hypothetical protein V6C81_13550 [Planktothrix sp.]|jgi:hypothetical protein